MKVLIFGASGSGTTTLGNRVGYKTDFVHLDVDDYYWKKTEPPFQIKIPLETRNRNLKKDFLKHKNVIITGSLVSWGKDWETAFDLAVFIYLNNNERMQRLKKREFERYGEKLSTDILVKENSIAFLNWANQYENPNFDGRSLKIHKNWLKSLNCKVLRIEGELELNHKIDMVIKKIEPSKQKK